MILYDLFDVKQACENQPAAAAVDKMGVQGKAPDVAAIMDRMWRLGHV